MQHIFPFHRYQFVIRNIQPCILVHVWVALETKVRGVTTGGVAVNGQIYEVTVPMPGFCFCRSGEAISGNKLVLRSTC